MTTDSTPQRHRLKVLCECGTRVWTTTPEPFKSIFGGEFFGLETHATPAGEPCPEETIDVPFPVRIVTSEEIGPEMWALIEEEARRLDEKRRPS